jgi:hypothetical protein
MTGNRILKLMYPTTKTYEAALILTSSRVSRYRRRTVYSSIKENAEPTSLPNETSIVMKPFDGHARQGIVNKPGGV